jgi:hypothetical protein
MIFLPYQKRTAMKITSAIGRNKMVSHPHGMFVIDYRHNIRPSLLYPSQDVFIPDIGDKVGETAFPAAAAMLFGGIIIEVHVFLY